MQQWRLAVCVFEGQDHCGLFGVLLTPTSAAVVVCYETFGKVKREEKNKTHDN